MDKKKIWVPVFLFAFAVGGFGLVIQARKINQMEKEMDWVKKELRSKAQIVRMEKRGHIPVDIIEPDPVKDMPPSHDKEGAYAGSSSPSKEEYDPIVITPETIRELQGVVKDQVREEMTKIKRKKDESVSMKQLSEELELDPYTENQMSTLYNECKDRGLALLTSLRSDGGNFMDDFVEAEASGTGGKEVWGRLFSDRIPGTDQTYFQRLMEIGGETTRNIERLLTPEQGEDYGSFDVDPFKVNTGYDPFEDYTRERNGR